MKEYTAVLKTLLNASDEQVMSGRFDWSEAESIITTISFIM
jgi:hypothetical protein